MMAYTADMAVELEKRLGVVDAANRLAVERGNNLLAELTAARAENERLVESLVAHTRLVDGLIAHIEVWGHDTWCSSFEDEVECDCSTADLRALLDEATS